MIEWIKYETANPPEHWNNFIITNGKKVNVAFLDTCNKYGLQWRDADTNAMHTGITHYAHINLPGEDKADV